jgi:hypothetical protein|uniref:Uncharacterized protein n=1 Tax=Populus trichocarpa TaxID=3694 RepID=U5GJY2_POPTR
MCICVSVAAQAHVPLSCLIVLTRHFVSGLHGGLVFILTYYSMSINTIGLNCKDLYQRADISCLLWILDSVSFWLQCLFETPNTGSPG